MKLAPYTALLVFLLALTACSGSRSERITSECLSDEQCGAGLRCEAERCVQVESASVEARGAVEGAPPGVQVEQQVVGDELCELRGETLVCTTTRGSRVVLVAPEVAGFRFVGWSGPPVCTGTERTLELAGLNENIECTARYVRRLRVTGETASEGAGLVVASAGGEFARCEQNYCEVDQGTTVTLMAPERDGFRLVGFDGAGCEDRAGYRLTVMPTQADVTCVARYVESLTVRGQLQGIDPALVEQGSIVVTASSPAKDAVCEGQLCAVDPGQIVTLVAPSVPGYRFRGWVGDASCSGSALQVDISDVTTNIVCSADYVRRVTVRAESEGASAALTATADEGFPSCTGASCEVDQGSTVTLFASTVAGYRLRDWTGEGCAGADGSLALARDVQSDVVCTAHFVLGVAVSGTIVNADVGVVAHSTSPGAACGAGRCTIDVGGTVTLTVPALAGRTFRGWSGDPGCTGSDRALIVRDVAESTDCLATFAPRYQALGQVAPENAGQVSATSSAANARCADAACEVDEGGTVILTATPSAGFRFTGWSGGGACTSSAARLELAELGASLTCVANFVARIEISGAAEPADAASIVASSRSSEAQCAGARCTVDRGADVMLSATAGEGYRFTGWSGCGSPVNPLLQNNPLLVVGPTASERCTAQFERITYSVAASAETGGSVRGEVAGRPCADARCTVEHGGSAAFVAEAAEGYSFAGWTDCVTSREAAISVANVTSNQTCRATFARLRFTVAGVAGTGGSVAASTDGRSCVNARCTVDHGASVSLTATADTGAAFLGWSGCSDSSEPTLTLASVTSNQTCTARFRALEYNVRGVAAPSAGGSVSCASGCMVRHGADVELTATANSARGYRFAGWSGCTPADDNPLALTGVTADRVCTARFELVPVTASATVTPASTGSVTATSMSMGARCSGASCTVPYGGSVTLRARPAADQRFTGWSGPSACTGGNPLTLGELTADTRCTATFAPTRWDVTFVARSGLTTVSIDTGGAACAGGSCTRTVGANGAVTVNVRFSTPTPSAVPVLSGWSGCTPVETELSASIVGDAYALIYTSTFRNFSEARTCTAQIVNGTFATFAGTNTVPLSVSPSVGWCSPLDAQNYRAELCFAPPSATLRVSSGFTRWNCRRALIPNGTGSVVDYEGGDVSLSTQAGLILSCGGD